MSKERLTRVSEAAKPAADVPEIPQWEQDDRSLLNGYPGAALMVRADGSVIAASDKGAGLEALLKHNAAPEIVALIDKAGAGTIVSGTVTLKGSKGDVVLEIVVVPGFGGSDGDGRLLVLARDLTTERNLRSALVESRQRYKDLVEISTDFSWEVDTQGTFVFVSPKGALGYKAEEIVNRPASAFVVNPQDYSPLPFLTERPIENVELWMRRADNSTACVVLAAVPLYDADGRWRGARGNCKDVTEERESEAALARARHREQLLHYIVGTIRDEVEPTNMLTAAAAATARALGAAGCQIHRLSTKSRFVVAAEYGTVEGLDGLEEVLKTLKGEGDVKAIRIGDWNALTTATHYRHAINGAISMWWPASKGEWDDDHHLLLGDVANQLGIANEQIANHERIVALSRTDGMTGLLNRRAFFEEELPRRLSRLERNRQTAAIYYVDMDNFKLVNDVRGHQAGDEAIIALRDMLMEFSRPGDVIARLGGDEFAMWLDGITPEVAVKRAETLLKGSERLRQYSGSPERPLGISVGVAVYDPAQGETLDDLLARADTAMYAVKHAGKGGFHVAPPPGTPLNLPPDEAKKKRG
jgi:diguanylate cyclase (GGDEF)-like protein/PAS domain S-box-containing protein